MNPPHIGHAKVIQTVHRLARKLKASHHVALSASYGDSKNPLEPRSKLKYVQKSFPGTIIKLWSLGLLQLVEFLNGQYDVIHLVAGEDRVKEYEQLLNKYNGKTYYYDKIVVHSAGHRNAKRSDISGLSATKMRKYAVDGDFNSFKRFLSPNLSFVDAMNLFKEVQRGLNVQTEDLQYNQDFARSMMNELFAKGYPIVPDEDKPNKDVAVKAIKKAARKKRKQDVGTKIVNNMGTGIGPTLDTRASGGAGAASGGIGDPSFREGYWEPMMPAYGLTGSSHSEPMQRMGDKVLSNVTGFTLKSRKKKNFQQLRKSLPYG